MSGSYFFGSVSIVGKSIRKVVISNSRITTSAVDMNLQNITSVKDPEHSQDAATKWYVDSSAGRIAQDVSNMFSGIIVTLDSCNFTEIANLKPGSYLVTITPVQEGGPTAVFSISKTTVYSMGFPVRISATPALDTLEQLELRWVSGQNLELRKTGPGYDGEYLVDMNVKNLSSVPYEPVIESDSATKAYVDHSIRTALDIKFGGIQVELNSTEFSNVTNLRPGSYMIAVTAIGITGAPTAAFSISKNSTNKDADVIRTSSCLGDNTHESLELTWPPNSMVVLRKTGAGYNGTYLIDFNLKNFSAADPVNIPTDLVTKDYVDNKIEELIDIKFGGVTVMLDGTDPVNVINLRPGTYIVTITSLVTGGPTASFSISKVSSFMQANSIIRLSSHSGIDTNEVLDLIWPENSMLMLRKTAPFHNGQYLVDFNLKNIGTSIPQVPNDLATKEYVDVFVKENLNVNFGGILVTLNSALFSPVITPRLGSFIIAISPLVSGGPTATFVISKSTLESSANIQRITSSVSDNSNVNLELTWPENSQLLLRKTGPFFDGEYLVDFNLKNFSTAPPPTVPSDIATKAFTENLIQQEMSVKFGGVQVTLVDSLIFEVAALKVGSYIITVTPTFDGGPTATFSISKSSLFGTGHVSVLTSSQSTTLENIELFWPENSKLLIRKNGPHHDGDYIVDFNLKNFSQAPPPIIPSDLATKAYVDHALQTLVDFKFGGVIVPLVGIAFSDIAAINPGSYIVSIISKVYGGPTATFSISKNVVHQVGHVVRITENSGYNTNETLELSWPENSKLLLRKTGIFHDGEYIVDLNLKNFSASVEPVVETDIATRNFVEQTFENKLDAHFSGVTVSLLGTSFVDVTSLKAGSYLITVTCTTDGGPTATFNLSKSSIVNGNANIVRTTSSPSDTGEILEIDWPENSKIKLRKTGIFFDGEYIVDFNLRNFSTAPTIIPTDAATKAFVLYQIKQSIDLHFGGTRTHLDNTTFSQVAPLKPGSYIVTVSPLFDGGASATFSISKSSQFSTAHIIRTTSSPGNDFHEELELTWPENSQLLLRKNIYNNNGEYLVDFNLRNFSFEPPPLVDTNLVTKEYLDQKIQESIESKFGGVSIDIIDSTSYVITDLNLGSYNITVSPTFTGGPSAVFSVSKSDHYTAANIVQISSSIGTGGTNDTLLLSWNEQSPLAVSKNGTGNFGTYIVNFNLLNVNATTTVTPPLENTSLKKNIHLVDTEPVIIFTTLQPGSYLVTVSSTVTSAPNSTFSVSKGILSQDANISTITLFSPPSGETLTLTWLANDSLKLSKSDFAFNGIYTVKII